MYFSEISASLYPWDLADEGIEAILGNLQELTACNSVYLIALMHHEKRPLTDYFYPHNPVRKSYCPEDSRAYFRPSAKHYGRIKPRVSERDFLKGTDWLQVMVEAARNRKMKTGVELSHTVIDAERAQGELADCIQRDIYDSPLGQQICPNNPDATEYFVGLVSDLAANYDVDFIQTCLMPYDFKHYHQHPAIRLLGAALGGCFCKSCEQAAQAAGLDFGEIKAALRPVADSLSRPTLEQARDIALLAAGNISEAEKLMELPELYQWLVFRRDSLVHFYRQVHQAAHAIKPSIDLRLNAYITANQELSGLSLRALAPCLDSVRSSDYSEQSGDIQRLEHKRKWLMAVRHAVAEKMHFLSAIGTRPQATPEIIRQAVVVSAQCGADGITIGHYDGTTFTNLKAVKEGLELADIILRQR